MKIRNSLCLFRSRMNHRIFTVLVNKPIDHGEIMPVKCEGFTIGDAIAHEFNDMYVKINLYLCLDPALKLSISPDDFSFKVVNGLRPRLEAYLKY